MQNSGNLLLLWTFKNHKLSFFKFSTHSKLAKNAAAFISRFLELFDLLHIFIWYKNYILKVTALKTYKAIFPTWTLMICDAYDLQSLSVLQISATILLAGKNILSLSRNETDIAQNALQQERGNFPFANWNGICWGLPLQLVQLIKIHFLPHLESFMWERKFEKKFFKKSLIQSPNGVQPICKLPFPNGSYRNGVCRALWALMAKSSEFTIRGWPSVELWVTLQYEVTELQKLLPKYHCRFFEHFQPFQYYVSTVKGERERAFYASIDGIGLEVRSHPKTTLTRWGTVAK